MVLEIMRRDHSVDELLARMLRRDAESLARLRHPNIAAIHESDQPGDGDDFFAMELVPGVTLDLWLAGRPAPVEDGKLELRLGLFRLICSADRLAHRCGVTHRDLEPTDIILTVDAVSLIAEPSVRPLVEMTAALRPLPVVTQLRQKGRFMNLSRTAVLATVLLLGTGCAADQPAAKATDTIAPAATSATNSGGGDVLALPGATVRQPAGWVFRAPSSSMRLAEAEIPGPGGPALLTVFFFGAGGGGGIDANLERWAGQMEADPGADTVRDRFTVNGCTVSTISVAGTLLPSRMGGGPSEPTPGSRLLGAVIEGPGGPWFFKMTGPADTVTAAAAEFDEMLRSISP